MALIQTLTSYQLAAGGRIFAPNSVISLSDADYAALASGDKGTKWADYVAVLDSGTYEAAVAAPTGVAATDSAAVQAAHDALPSGGGKIILRAGTYALGTTGLTISKRVKMVGAGGLDDAGNAGTLLTYTSLTGTAITVSANGCVFEDFAVVNTNGSNPTAGAGILFNSGRFARLVRVDVRNFWNNVEFADGFYWKLTDCNILDPANYGLYLHNTSPSKDWGDGSVKGCTFTVQDTTRNAAAAVRWESGGGFYFTGNKINGGLNPAGLGSAGKFTNGLDFAVADGTTTSVLNVSGNSIENCTSQAILIHQAGTTGNFSKVVVVGNEIAISGVGVWIIGTSSGQIKDVLVASNVFTNMPGMLYAKNVSGLVVGTNRLTSYSGNAIQIDTGCTDYSIGKQNVTGAGQLLLDSSADDSGHNLAQTVEHHYVREIPTTTSSVTFTDLYRFSFPAYGGVVMNVRMSGAVSTVGVFTVDATRVCQRGASGAVVVTTIGTDTNTGAATPQLSFDTTTVSGEVRVKVASPTSTSNDVSGVITVHMDGVSSGVRKS